MISPVTECSDAFSVPAGEYFAVKLSPYASHVVYQLFGKITPIANRIIPASEVFPSLSSLTALLRQSGNESVGFHLLSQYFFQQFRFAVIPARAERILSEIILSNCTITEPALSARIGLSSRRIYQICMEQLGCSAKMLSRILRFQNALFWLLEKPHNPADGTPYELNYYDQSHFLKEFQKFCGILPSEMQQLMRTHSVN